MEYLIQPEDKQYLLELTEMFKGKNIPDWKTLILLGYMRGQADEIMISRHLQPTGT